jgi:hypothetical protein
MKITFRSTFVAMIFATMLFHLDVRRRLPPQIPLVKAHLEAQSYWRPQISLDTTEKGSGKASITSRRPTRGITRT